ncbi:hypothetical protein HZS_193 [Henneguya salminicola]|nr:hypothetical protein HZS_193 [Henneguya salminicola]
MRQRHTCLNQGAGMFTGINPYHRLMEIIYHIEQTRFHAHDSVGKRIYPDNRVNVVVNQAQLSPKTYSLRLLLFLPKTSSPAHAFAVILLCYNGFKDHKNLRIGQKVY